MNKKSFLLITLVSFALACYAEDTLLVPEKRLQTGVEKSNVYTHEYDQESGFSFSPNSKPKYYDPIYHDYFMNGTTNMIINYPTFFMQGLNR